MAGAREILGRELHPEEAAGFSKYLELLQKWQRVHRLVGSTEPEWIVSHLFLDSLLFTRLLPSHVRLAILDFGSGAGFPGVPIRIVEARVQMTLLEARARRVSFLRALVRELSLDGVTVLASRGEGLAAEGFGEKFDVVVARCAGERREVIRAALPLLRPAGRLIISGSPDEVAMGTRGSPVMARHAARECSTESPAGIATEVRTVPGPVGPRSFLVISTGR